MSQVQLRPRVSGDGRLFSSGLWDTSMLVFLSEHVRVILAKMLVAIHIQIYFCKS